MVPKTILEMDRNGKISWGLLWVPNVKLHLVLMALIHLGLALWQGHWPAPPPEYATVASKICSFCIGFSLALGAATDYAFLLFTVIGAAFGDVILQIFVFSHRVMSASAESAPDVTAPPGLAEAVTAMLMRVIFAITTMVATFAHAMSRFDLDRDPRRTRTGEEGRTTTGTEAVPSNPLSPRTQGRTHQTAPWSSVSLCEVGGSAAPLRGSNPWPDQRRLLPATSTALDLGQSHRNTLDCAKAPSGGFWATTSLQSVPTASPSRTAGRNRKPAADLAKVSKEHRWEADETRSGYCVPCRPPFLGIRDDPFLEPPARPPPTARPRHPAGQPSSLWHPRNLNNHLTESPAGVINLRQEDQVEYESVL